MLLVSVGCVVSLRRAARRRVFTARRAVEVVELALNAGGVGRQFMDGTAGILGLAAGELGIALLGRRGDDLLALLDRLRVPAARCGWPRPCRTC